MLLMIISEKLKSMSRTLLNILLMAINMAVLTFAINLFNCTRSLNDNEEFTLSMKTLKNGESYMRQKAGTFTDIILILCAVIFISVIAEILITCKNMCKDRMADNSMMEAVGYSNIKINICNLYSILFDGIIAIFPMYLIGTGIWKCLYQSDAMIGFVNFFGLNINENIYLYIVVWAIYIFVMIVYTGIITAGNFRQSIIQRIRNQ